ncbi:hypothetical protein BJV78DRAFT_1280341 [Lactifluus subvellereus]|nr:hypothetical protein BJV78DRAFT_1280341 [Lactifluus subvellereus]
MSQASSTLEQLLFTESSLQKREDSAKRGSFTTSGLDDVQGSPNASKGECTLDTDKTLIMHSPSPLPLPLQAACEDSDADTALAPLSPILTTEGVAKGGDDVTTSAMVFSDSQATDKMGLTRPSHSLPDLPVELPETSEPLSTVPSGSSLISRKCSLDATAVYLTCSPSSSDLQAATSPTVLSDSDLLSCFVPAPTVEIDPSGPDTSSDNAELFVNRFVTCSELKSPTGPTTLANPSPCFVDISSPSPAVTHFPSCEISLGENIQSSTCDLKTRQSVPSPKLSALLTPLPLVDTVARHSSPSLPRRNSGSSAHLTAPQSSPRTESSVMTVEDRAWNEEAVCTSNHTDLHDYPTRVMSSPTLYGDESALSPSPPHQVATSAKRATCDDSDEDWTSTKPVKRIRMDDTMSSPLRNAPAPRRATLASQKLSRKRLVAPFRSPLQTETTSMQSVTRTREEGRDSKQPQAKRKGMPNPAQESCIGIPKTIRSLVLSSRAAAQFRSPLVKAPAHASRPIILPNQTIMDLERKLTILRRAIKIKRDDDESHLDRLARKWRDAGREAAYELWGIVRDLSADGGEVRGNASHVGWGWDDQGEHGMPGEGGLTTEDGGDEEKQENSLGMMLRKLGIAPETLGWNDEEGTFVDDD